MNKETVITAYRTRKDEIAYRKHRSATKHDTRCQFCVITVADDQFVSRSRYFKVIRNKFKYNIWDGQRVVDHLMIVPLLHTDTLAELPVEAAKEFLESISEYEQRGYNVYARAPGSNKKSVMHQHTHLIKLDGKVITILAHIKKPFMTFAK